VELEPVVAATTVVNPDIWLALAQAQLAQVVFQVLVVVLVPRVVDLVADLLLVVDLLVDPVLLLATSAEVPTTLPVTAKPRP
jgi:hypothetical protein